MGKQRYVSSMIGDLPSEAGKPLVLVTFSKLWTGLSLRRSTTMKISSLLLCYCEYMCTLQPVARFPFCFFPTSSSKLNHISRFPQGIILYVVARLVPEFIITFSGMSACECREVQFLCIEPIGNIRGLVSLKWNMTLCEIWIKNYIGLYIIVQKYSLHGREGITSLVKVFPTLLSKVMMLTILWSKQDKNNNRTNSKTF